MEFIDYYAVLGVSKTATDKEIKQAYRKLAKQYHPDLYNGAQKAENDRKFKQINEAHEVLSNAEKRAEYDRIARDWLEYGGSAQRRAQQHAQREMRMDDLNGFSDFFAAFFGGDPFGRASAYGAASDPYDIDELLQRRRPQAADIEAHLELPLEALLRGTEQEFQISVGRTRRTVTVKIPPKSPPGTVLRLKGLGETTTQGNVGDLLLQINAAVQEPWRIVNELDLEGELMIRPEQAVLGDTVTVKTPGGNVQVKIAAGSHAGHILRLKGQGFKASNGALGNLLLKLRIDIPATQSAAEIELYRRIAALRPSDGQ